MRNKKELIERFIEFLTPESDVDEDWLAYVEEQRRAELDRIIADENLNHDEAYKFMDNAFRDGFVQTTGTAITKVLPPVSRITPTGDRTKKREAVIDRLTAQMNQAAKEMRFEQAAMLRDRIRDAQNLMERQKAIHVNGGDQDILA